MTETILMRGASAITDPRLGPSGVIPAGAVVITDGIVRETGRFGAIAPKYPDAYVIGDGTQLLMPGLVDAHSHGRGLSPIQKGVRNDFLENALFDWAYMPILPPELSAAVCALRHLRSGCTLLHHNGFDDDGAEGARRAHIAIRTYLSTGIRLAFSPGVCGTTWQPTPASLHSASPRSRLPWPPAVSSAIVWCGAGEVRVFWLQDQGSPP